VLVKLNVGCGQHVAPGFLNLDNSPSLYLQSHSWLRAAAQVMERILGRRLYTRFPADVAWCDVRRGLPYKSESALVVYSSHMLEHLPRREAEGFLREAYRILAPGGVLRLAVPDLERQARSYVSLLDQARTGGAAEAPADAFMRSTILGVESLWSVRRPQEICRVLYARDRHAWMWDGPSLTMVLRRVGFGQVAERGFRESVIPEVDLLDLESRREESLYVEAEK
jgi:SAM-dependent methyltransferase